MTLEQAIERREQAVANFAAMQEDRAFDDDPLARTLMYMGMRGDIDHLDTIIEELTACHAKEQK